MRASNPADGGCRQGHCRHAGMSENPRVGKWAKVTKLLMGALNAFLIGGDAPSCDTGRHGVAGITPPPMKEAFGKPPLISERSGEGGFRTSPNCGPQGET